MLRSGFERGGQVYYKGAIDVVTDSDRQVEDFLIHEIRSRYPDHNILAEESGETPGAGGATKNRGSATKNSGGATWFIDPMDGTVNFAHGLPIFAVSIGYSEAGIMRFGVVYDPMRDELFHAELGSGAQLNGSAIHASQASILDTSLLVTEFGYDIRINPQNNLDHYSYFTLHTQGVRQIGSAVLDLCYVACGRFDGYWELRSKPWDLAAGGLIAAEAGATVTNLMGQDSYVIPPCSILAAAPDLHPQMLQMFQHQT